MRNPTGLTLRFQGARGSPPTELGRGWRRAGTARPTGLGNWRKNNVSSQGR